MNKKIICKPLDLSYINIAIEMAQENYEIERQSTTALPRMDNRPFYQSKLQELFEKGMN